MQTLSIHQRFTYQYEGFLKGQDIRAIPSQIVFPPLLTNSTTLPSKITLDTWQKTISPRLVLGKRVEHFMSYYLKNHSQYKILTQNIQVFNEKTTIGELDFLIQNSLTQEVIHLEQVYKFTCTFQIQIYRIMTLGLDLIIKIVFSKRWTN